MKKHIVRLLLAATFLTVFTVLTACAHGNAPQNSGVIPRVAVLNGTTGFGMAPMMQNRADAYSFAVENDASVITAALINGSVDIAALPTNAAANLYQKTKGGVQLIALNTRGVLYVVVNTDRVTVRSLRDLEGRTVYVPAQNPTFLFKAVCENRGVNVTVENTYAQPADLRSALVSGAVDIAVLPEPMVTIATAANESLAIALDLTEEWDAFAAVPGSLVQGCVVVRTAFAGEHPDAVKAFLADYEGSVDFVNLHPTEAGEMIASQNIFSNAAVAAKAIPRCNICFITGKEMQTTFAAFAEEMFRAAPASVGNALPGNDFYYIP